VELKNHSEKPARILRQSFYGFDVFPGVGDAVADVG
jgi:hypothetical protein